MSADLRSGREVGAFHELHQIVDRAIGVVDIVRDAVAQFRKVVRRNVRCHADCDAGRAVQEKVGEFGGAYL